MNQTLMQNALNLRRSGRFNEAADIYLQILREDPKHFEATHALGILRYQTGQLDEAVRLVGEAKKLNPQSPDASYNHACLLQRLNRPEEALASFDAAIALKPDYLEALVNRSSLLGQLKRHSEALASLDKIVELRPMIPEAWSNRASALLGLDRNEDALTSADRALTLRPNFLDALKNRGLALMALGRSQEALDCLDKAQVQAPNDPALLNSRAEVLMRLNRRREAAAAYEKYLLLVPADAGAWHGRGIALQQERQLLDAITCFDKSVALAPDSWAARVDRANLNYEMERFEQAAADYQFVADFDPNYQPYLRGYLELSRLHCCDWRSIATGRKAIGADVLAGRFAIDPMGNAVFGSTPEQQYHAARTWVRERYPQAPLPVWMGERYNHDRIRIAYLSADFRMHATALLMAGVFESHDRSRFEVSAISYSADDRSTMRTRLLAAFDRFVEARGMSDAEVARMMRDMEIDIAIDLKGFTTEARPGILALRPAPVQAQYLGYPGTMAADYVDYVIADKIVIPEDDLIHYSEKVAYLPDSYQCNDRQRVVAPRIPTRAEVGLPEKGFVFCCLNNDQKILPEMFDVWMRLLQGVENSVLWLLEDNAGVPVNLRREAEARGVSGKRLVFARRTTPPEHLARQMLADLFLDTTPYNAHTTASDALWVGLPVLTTPGATFASRVAASLLISAGLPEMIAPSLDVYEAMALKLAREPDALEAVKTKLKKNRDTCALFDTRRITRNLEAAYTLMHERHLAGASPEHFSVGIPKSGSQ